MKKVLNRKSLALAAGLVTIGLTAGAASALTYCYKWNIFPDERLRLSVNLGERLTLPQEELNFSHPAQDALTVLGKHAGLCGPQTMATVTGTIVRATRGTGRNNFGPTGMHLGIRTHSVRVANITNIFCKEVTLDCSTTENTGLVPFQWICFS